MSNGSNKSNVKKIVIALSGGVDSSVAAALLKKQCFNVVGIMLKLGAPLLRGRPDNKCCDLQAVEDARRVCGKLKIPFYLIDVQKEFREIVVQNFLDEYAAGRTPNPCVLCNREIKFGLLRRKASALGADFLATGHYARIISVRVTLELTASWPLYQLFRAKDRNKDQSYMLWRLRQDDLAHLIFPLGNYLKSEVRELARKWGLPTSEKRESQEICFVADNYRQFLKKYLPRESWRSGLIKNLKGEILGAHEGLSFYTEGQRVAISNPKIPDFVAHYVVRKDLKNNALIVVPRNSKELLSQEMRVEKVNWLRPPRADEKLLVQIRYHHDPILASARRITHHALLVTFGAPQRAVTPGQSAVFYVGEELVGGGVVSGR